MSSWIRRLSSGSAWGFSQFCMGRDTNARGGNCNPGEPNSRYRKPRAVILIVAWPYMSAGLRYCGLWCVVSLFLCAPSNARGHAPSETFLTLFLTPTNVSGHWDVALRDLRQGLTPGADPLAVTPPDLEQRQEALALDTIARLRVNADGTNLALTVTDHLPVTLQHGEYVRVEFSAAALPVATA